MGEGLNFLRIFLDLGRDALGVTWSLFACDDGPWGAGSREEFVAGAAHERGSVAGRASPVLRMPLGLDRVLGLDLERGVQSRVPSAGLR